MQSRSDLRVRQERAADWCRQAYLDYLFPFAGFSEIGREIDGLDSRSELAHRVTVVLLLRILVAVKTKKASRLLSSLRRISNLFRPAMVPSVTTASIRSVRISLEMFQTFARQAL